MKLSEAILLGSIATKQGFGSESITSATEPCALGAALLAIGKQPKFNQNILAYQIIREEWPWASNIVDMIWKLNDYNIMSRVEIAEWVKSIEPNDNVVAVNSIEKNEVICGVH